MKTYLVLDVSYLCHRAHYTTGHLTFNDDPTGALYGFFRDLQTFEERFDTPHFIFCFDHGKGKRKEILPTYKTTRHLNKKPEELETYENLQKQIEQLRTKMLREIGFKNLFWQAGYEADDVIASVTMHSLGDDDDAIIISSDQDLWQLISERTVVYNPSSKKMINKKSFMAEWGIDPVIWSQVKAIAGCSSDDIVGIPRVGEKTACKWIRGILKESTMSYKNILNGLSTVNSNIQLTKLPFPGTEVFEIKEDNVRQINWRKLMNDLGFNSLV